MIEEPTIKITNRMLELITYRVGQTGIDSLKIGFMSVGNGGESIIINDMPTMTSLVNEIWRGDIDNVTIAPDDPSNMVVITGIIPKDAGPFEFNEIGIWDDGTDNNGVPELMVIATYPMTQKIAPIGNAIDDIQISVPVLLTVGDPSLIDLTLNPYVHELVHHAHTGDAPDGDGTTQINHNRLINIGNLTHGELELNIGTMNTRISTLESGLSTTNNNVNRNTQYIGYAAPVGVIQAYWGTSAPYGWLICNGDTIPNGSEYDELRALVGSNVPDLRGMFLRMITGTRAIGSYEADEFKAHNHSDGTFNQLLKYDATTTVTSYDSTIGEPNLAFSGTIQTNGGAETRPKNIGVNFIIKY